MTLKVPYHQNIIVGAILRLVSLHEFVVRTWMRQVVQIDDLLVSLIGIEGLQARELPEIQTYRK